MKPEKKKLTSQLKPGFSLTSNTPFVRLYKRLSDCEKEFTHYSLSRTRLIEVGSIGPDRRTLIYLAVLNN